MGSRDRETKSFQDKLKVFFKKGSQGAPASRNELAVTEELERELGSETPLPRRLRAVRDLADRAHHVRLQEGGVEKIWRCTRDLLADGTSAGTEARHVTLVLLRALAEAQAERLTLMRTVLMRYLRESHAAHAPVDTQLRFRLLHALTNEGKNITCFEEQMGPFLLEWMSSASAAPPLLVDLLQLTTNVVKYNATYLDERIVHHIVNSACHLCVYSADGDVVSGCLALLEAVVSYSLLPRGALHTFVCALCRTVNMEHYCQTSWKLMRSVMGGDMGHAALQDLVRVVRGEAAGGVGGAEAEEADAGTVRGAVFYVNMALWGPRCVPSLRVSYLAVLPAFLKALERGQQVVTYEVVAGVQSAVSRAGAPALCEPAWDVLLRILHKALQQDKNCSPPNEMIHSRLHAALSALEQLADSGNFAGEPDALLDLLDAAGHDRPEASTMRVVSKRAAALSATSSEWVSAALALADKYLRHEPRRAVRVHALHELVAFIRRHRYVYGSELVELVGVPVLAACALDADAGLRAEAALALTALAAGPTVDACTDLVDLLEKILNRPFEMYVTDVPIPPDADVTDLRRAVAGLLQLLHDKLVGSPGALPLRCFLVLLDHLDNHYKRPALFQHHPDLRLKIFDMVFGLRANSFNCVGFCYDASGAPVSGAGSLRMKPLCSPFLLAETPIVRGQHQPPPQRDLPAGSCMVPCGRLARVVVSALTRECEWTVLGAVLRSLPTLLQAHALAVGRRAQDLDLLASTLCSMISDRSLNFPECLRTAAGQKPLVSEFHGAALPALAAMPPYHSYLEPQTQQRIVRCLLKYGMVLRTPQPYINALTIYTLETRDTMVKMLPEVLLDLSKISDTQAIASPMLEFLSTLTRLPKVFASFVEDQYMSVFAILLPYTNPSRYNHYVVSLAHHVIAAWFLKCRLSYRRNFVRFIIHGLHNYIIMPFEEQLHSRSKQGGQAAAAAVTANEDSSNRQRSSSLGSRAVSTPPAGLTRGAGAGASAAFHVELTETCVDLLARYTATPCSSKPTRSETARFLFDGGQSMTWLVGHKLVTITTSGCHQNSLKQGLCDRCATLCKQHADSISSPLPPLNLPPPPPALTSDHNDTRPEQPQSLVQVHVNDGDAESAHDQPEVKRYSKWSLQHSRSTDTSSSLSCSDLHAPSVPSGHTTRQNSSENSKTDPLVEILNHFTQRFERISKEVDSEEALWWRGSAAAASGACACWCAQWAELHVRAPTGDVCWLLRLQNQMNWDYLLESPLQDVAALLNPPSSPEPAVSPAHTPAPRTCSTSSGLGDSRHDVSELSLRSRSGSASSQRTRAAPDPPDLQDLHKSSSDSVVTSDRRAHGTGGSQGAGGASSHQLRMSTQPINIPASPQRAAAAPDNDVLLLAPEGKSRHPVRRSNSSPEMSSSWKVVPRAGGAGDHGGLDEDLPIDPEEMILLPSCEPVASNAGAGAGAGAHSKKPTKKSDMRVSCEAIPEEISGTSPLPHSHTHPHPQLCTFNSDPGAPPPPVEPPPAPTDAPAPTAAPAPLPHIKHNQLQKTASDGTVGEGRGSGGAPGSGAGRERDDLPPLARSKRSNTISVMSPTRRHRPATNHALSSLASSSSGGGGGGGGVAAGGAGAGGGVTPSFVFLQLYHNMSTYPITPPVPGEAQSALNPLAERPLRVSGVQHERTIKNLDLMPPVETYKVGVLYVGPGQQDDESAILRNEYGSVRYAEFLRALGSLVPLGAGAGAGGGVLAGEPLFLNLETGGKDGQYTYVWHDDVMQVQFHVATAMPNSDSDPNCNEKRKYIGNDFVSIVYNDSGHDFNLNTIKGGLNFCIVVVEGLAHGMSCVRMKSKKERILRSFLPHVAPSVVSDGNAALLARQLALHCSLASLIENRASQKGGAVEPYASNSLERLRAIKRLRSRVEDERMRAAARAPAPYADRSAVHQRVAIDDFNDYT